MSGKPRDPKNDLLRIVEALVDLAFEMPSDDFAATLRSEGRDPARVAEDLRTRMIAGLRSVQQHKLELARQQYKERVAAFSGAGKTLAGTTDYWRQQLILFFTSNAQAKALATVQFRDLKSLSDEDVMNLALRLCELGYLNDGRK